MDKSKQVTIREQIEWMLDKIEDKKTLTLIFHFINRVYVGGRW